MRGSVISETLFREGLSMILEGKYKFAEVPCPDTSELVKGYEIRFSMKSVIDSIAKRRNKYLVKYFPVLFLKKIMLQANR